MLSSFKPSRFRSARGFSLIELLLAMVLLGLLLGAVAFNFATLQTGSKLNEGSTRFATMLSYARSHAAYTGRAVRLSLKPMAPSEETGDAGEPMRSFVLEWEPNPLSEPGRFRILEGTSWDLDELNELVGIASMEIPRPLLGRSMPTRGVKNGVVVEESIQDTDLTQDPSLTFYPDGASDTARIVLASRDAEDLRRIELRLEGITGTVESNWLEAEKNSETESGLEEEPSPNLDELSAALGEELPNVMSR